jgi:uncharacterized damage-inducible protein DinB
MSAPEAWLRGPVPGITHALQPAAHALLQARDDVERALATLTDDEAWVRPGDAASVGFHCVHMAGSTDRLLTYARGEGLSETQRADLSAEARAAGTTAELLDRVKAAIQSALAQLSQTPAESLFYPRFVGRARLPSTVLGLLFHAAEHASRHAGQVVTTALIVRAARGAR